MNGCRSQYKTIKPIPLPLQSAGFGKHGKSFARYIISNEGLTFYVMQSEELIKSLKFTDELHANSNWG